MSLRTIEFRFDVPDVDPQQFRNAIAYLTLWALDRYDTVRIYNDGAFDLVAVYTNPDNQPTLYDGRCLAADVW